MDDGAKGGARSFRIETAGRDGQWEYSSMEDALLAGKAAAEKLG